MHDGIAQHVLEWRQHLVQHLPVQFTGGTLDSQFGALAGFLGDLPDQSGQARHMTFERHHAGAHESVLKLCRHARLLHQQAFRLGRQRLQQVLEAAQVIRRFGESTRQLLHIGIAIQLERVEIPCNQRVLMPVHDLSFSLDFELPQLFAQTRDSLFEFIDMEFERVHLLTKSRVIDADLAGRVKEFLQQLGIDARELLPLVLPQRLRGSRLLRLRLRRRRCLHHPAWSWFRLGFGRCRHGLERRWLDRLCGYCRLSDFCEFICEWRVDDDHADGIFRLDRKF